MKLNKRPVNWYSMEGTTSLEANCPSSIKEFLSNLWPDIALPPSRQTVNSLSVTPAIAGPYPNTLFFQDQF